MDNVLTKLVSGKLSTYAAIILMFTYSLLLDRDFACACQPEDFHCRLYIALPIFTIFLLILWTDRPFQRVCRYLISGALGCCGRPHTCSFLGSFFRKILKAFLVSLLWVAFVYIDGDWYVCCQNNGSEEQAQLACKVKEKNLTHVDLVLIAGLKNESRVIGGFLLFSIVLVASLIPLCGRTPCCGNSGCCNRKVLHEELFLEEKQNALREIVKDLAKEDMIKVKDKIHRGQWDDVAEELMKTSAGEQGGGATESQQQQEQQPGQEPGKQKEQQPKQQRE
ncbi:uncharacterized protein LOC119906177 [Micropterus salmoides]|uniref:uncharacterized protein LOC119906177 n=1 Tax=Micropterus salmoides TaxID=27706 RepID=UPI0018EA462F|nr:uncharacterized protein LOC119906177 [Micropterus salmoides]